MATLGRNKNEELHRADGSDKWAVPSAAPIRVPGAHPTPTRTLPTAPPSSRRPTTPGTTLPCNPNNSLSDLRDVGLVIQFFLEFGLMRPF